MSLQEPSETARAGWGRPIGIALAAVAALTLVLLAFSWPNLTSEPKNLPLSVVGSDAQVTQLEQTLAAQPANPFDFERVADRDEAVKSIQQRESYGAIVLPEMAEGQSAPAAPEILTATAANPSVAQMLQGVATGMETQINGQVTRQVEQQVQTLIDGMKKAAQAPQAPAPGAGGQQPQLPDEFTIPHVDVKVTDVVPLADTDERGTGLAMAAMPMVIGGMIGAVLISTVVRTPGRRLVALAAYGIVGGLTLAGVLQGWFGALQGNYWTNALAIGVSLLAIAAVLVGLHSLLGQPGLGLGAVVMFLFANPISAAAAPKEFLPEPWGDIGQWFPPGAEGTLMRSLSYFPDASTAFQWWVLLGWVALGVVLIIIAMLRRGDQTAEVAAESARVDRVETESVEATA